MCFSSSQVAAIEKQGTVTVSTGMIIECCQLSSHCVSLYILQETVWAWNGRNRRETFSVGEMSGGWNWCGDDLCKNRWADICLLFVTVVTCQQTNFSVKSLHPLTATTSMTFIHTGMTSTLVLLTLALEKARKWLRKQGLTGSKASSWQIDSANMPNTMLLEVSPYQFKPPNR